MTKSYETILVEDRSKTRWITLNRIKQRNAFNLPLYRELREALLGAEEDENIRCVVIRGGGGNFSTGNDHSEALGKSFTHTYKPPRGFITIGNQTCWTIWQLKKPVIAAVEGYCLGGGFELAMTCDFVIADADAKLGEPEIRFADAPPWLISPWIMGLRQAKHILLTGDVISAEKAMSYGALTEVAPKGELEKVVTKLATKMEAFQPETWHYNKMTVNRVYEIMGFHAAIELGVDMFATIKTTANPLKQELTERINSEGFSAAIKWAQARFPKD
jgi:enoyl-CoA hydratase